MQLVRAWDEAVRVVSVMRDILQVRTTPVGCLPYFPAVREPRYGPLRTRVASYMEEFRYMLLRSLAEEGACASVTWWQVDLLHGMTEQYLGRQMRRFTL